MDAHQKSVPEGFSEANSEIPCQVKGIKRFLFPDGRIMSRIGNLTTIYSITSEGGMPSPIEMTVEEMEAIVDDVFRDYTPRETPPTPEEREEMLRKARAYAREAFEMLNRNDSKNTAPDS